MIPISIDEETCVGCGLCALDCPTSCICVVDGTARTGESGCIECGHCYAICPAHAITMDNYACVSELSVPMTKLDNTTLLSAMKSRRSVRRFDPRPVGKEKVHAILEAGRYAPTGSNAQNVSFRILGSKQEEIEQMCVELFRVGKKAGSIISSYLKRIEISDDFFFKGAPLVIAVSSPSPVNAGLASAYMELMAENLGLGVLYSGFFVVCAKMSRKLRKLLDLPEGHKVVSCLVIGYTSADVRYRRIPPRKEAQVKVL